MPTRGTLSSLSDPLFGEEESVSPGGGGGAASSSLTRSGVVRRPDPVSTTNYTGARPSSLLANGFMDSARSNNNSNSNSNPTDNNSSSSLGNASDIQIKDDDFSKPTSSKDEHADIFIVPPILTFLQMWGPTFTIFFFLGVLVFVLMWVYVYVSFNGYQDRITVLSLGNLFQQNPQARFQTYVQQTAQESIAAAMQDIATSNNNVQTSVNRLQSQMDANQTQQRSIDTILQPLLNMVKQAIGSSYMPNAQTVKIIAPAPV
jgi:hypothetical protein